jgi:hypothetical protein
LRAGVRAALAFWRTSGGGALALGAVGVLVAAHLLPLEPVRVPGRPDVRTVVWPLAPVLAALGVPTGAMLRFRSWERAAVRPAWHSRMAFVSLVALRSMVVIAFVSVDRSTILRNLLLFDGLALLVTAMARRPIWTALLVVPAVCWMAGTDARGDPHAWAVPLLAPGHLGAAVVSGAVGVTGLVAYVVWPPSWGFGATAVLGRARGSVPGAGSG